ncbi:MAG: hypothetical protein ACYS1A_19530 [Planctomycetota bacterium]|jgi:hypothetical protein
MIDFLNKCVELAPQATTALLDEKGGAVAKELRDAHKIAAVRNKTGKVIGFSEMVKAAKSKTKEMPPPKPMPSPVRVIKEDDETGGRGKPKKKTSIFDRKKKDN